MIAEHVLQWNTALHNWERCESLASKKHLSVSEGLSDRWQRKALCRCQVHWLPRPVAHSCVSCKAPLYRSISDLQILRTAAHPRRLCSIQGSKMRHRDIELRTSPLGGVKWESALWKLSDSSHEGPEPAKGAGSPVTRQRLPHACGLCDVRSSISR